MRVCDVRKMLLGTEIVRNNITMCEVIDLDVNTFSVKDKSVRGCHTAYVGDLKVGDEILLNNRFTEIIESNEKFELVKGEASLSPKEYKKYNEGDTICGNCSYPEIIKVFYNREEAMNELSNYENMIAGSDYSCYSIEEYAIIEYHYSESNESFEYAACWLAENEEEEEEEKEEEEKEEEEEEEEEEEKEEKEDEPLLNAKDIYLIRACIIEKIKQINESENNFIECINTKYGINAFKLSDNSLKSKISEFDFMILLDSRNIRTDYIKSLNKFDSIEFNFNGAS